MGAHVPFTQLLGGGLRGTLPNPEVVTDDASLIISGQVFGRRSFTEFPATSSSTGIVIDDLWPFLPKPFRAVMTVRGDSPLVVTEDALGPTVSLVKEAMVDAIRTYLSHSDYRGHYLDGDLKGFLTNPSIVTERLMDAVRVFMPHPQRVDQVRGSASIGVTYDALGVILAVVSETLVDSVRAFLRHDDYRGHWFSGGLSGFLENPSVVPERLVDAMRALFPHPPRIPEVQAGTNVTLAHNARGPVISASGGGGSVTVVEVEIDFGTKPVFDALFTVVDASVNAASKVTVTESGKTATGRTQGDAQWDSIDGAALPGAGSFQLFCTASPGPVVGRRLMQYFVS